MDVRDEFWNVYAAAQQQYLDSYFIFVDGARVVLTQTNPGVEFPYREFNGDNGKHYWEYPRGDARRTADAMETGGSDF